MTPLDEVSAGVPLMHAQKTADADALPPNAIDQKKP